MINNLEIDDNIQFYTTGNSLTTGKIIEKDNQSVLIQTTDGFKIRKLKRHLDLKIVK